MLIVHSQLDYRVDLSEGYQAFTALRKMGVPAKFLYFPDEGHWVTRPRNRRVWWGTVLDWLDQYLKPAGPGGGGRGCVARHFSTRIRPPPTPRCLRGPWPLLPLLRAWSL